MDMNYLAFMLLLVFAGTLMRRLTLVFMRVIIFPLSGVRTCESGPLLLRFCLTMFRLLFRTLNLTAWLILKLLTLYLV